MQVGLIPCKAWGLWLLGQFFAAFGVGVGGRVPQFALSGGQK